MYSQCCLFSRRGVFECDIAHHWSVAVWCMLYTTICNPMHPLYGTLPVPYLPMRVTSGALVGHRYTYAPSRCRTSQYPMTFIQLSISLWNNLANPVFDGAVQMGIKSRAIVFLLAYAVRSDFAYYCFPFLSALYCRPLKIIIIMTVSRNSHY